MDIGIISARYAKALLKYATDCGDTDEVYRSMSVLGQSFVNVPTLRAALENPVVDDEKKFHILNLAAGETSSESLKQFFKLVLKNRRIAMIQFMAHAFVDSYRKEKHLIHSHLTIPVELSAETLGRLKNLVKEKTNNEVEFVVEVDPSIIGGFIMEYDTYCFDASIRNRLKLIKKNLLNNNNFLASK
jgi:F-type H+-transporting ATPase subunit delta